ncbi:MAG: hypothetical protein ABIG73_01715 [Patescibacteria group bacterium]
MKKLFKNPKIKKAIGIVLIIFGLIALITPFTPGSWLIFVGLEFMGIRILFWDKIKSWFQKMIPDKQNKIKRIVFIIIITLVLISFVLPLAMGY